MPDETNKLLEEIAGLLRQQLEERRKVLGDAVTTLRTRPDFEKQREDMDRRMVETRARAEEHRQELHVYQEAVLSELRKISSLLEQLNRRSGGAE